jgi:HAD superfamily hydrolase (TIGR01509 family)
MKGAPDVLLFDLGGVLIHFDGIAGVRELSGERLGLEEARRFWLTSPALGRFETGRIDPEAFALEALAELGIVMPSALFLEQFLSWDRGPMPGAFSLLDALRPHFRLACLSNNNELHWRRLRDELRLTERFERCYLSHLLGLRKPDPAVFEHVVRDLGTPPERILFLDDNHECVEAARRHHLAAHQARGVQEVREILASLLQPEIALG